MTPMPKKSTPDSDLKAEFAELKSIAKEEKAAQKTLDAIKVRKRKTVHTMHHKQGANIGSMALVFGVSRQALAKEIRTAELAKGNKPAAKAPVKKAAAPSSSTSPARRLRKV